MGAQPACTRAAQGRARERRGHTNPATTPVACPAPAHQHLDHASAAVLLVGSVEYIHGNMGGPSYCFVFSGAASVLRALTPNCRARTSPQARHRAHARAAVRQPVQRHRDPHTAVAATVSAGCGRATARANVRRGRGEGGHRAADVRAGRLERGLRAAGGGRRARARRAQRGRDRAGRPVRTRAPSRTGSCPIVATPLPRPSVRRHATSAAATRPLSRSATQPRRPPAASSGFRGPRVVRLRVSRAVRCETNDRKLHMTSTV